ncbi:MAG: patatin-like phospholipase family protein [Proteobacteria bacterium]|nr:patatin-like phospholipase family protein [Pseudomonadota bacterium]
MSARGRSLVFRAGAGALESVRKHGFAAERIGTFAGASGGAKWLVLSQLDRVVLEKIVPRLEAPVHLLGSSIGAWRFACYAQRDPLDAIRRFEDAYFEQSYSDRLDRAEISAKSREILDHVIGPGGVRDILTHPVLRTHVMTVRSRHLMASDIPLVLSAGLLATAACNLLSRRTLGLFFERALISDTRDRPPFHAPRGFPMQRVALSADNLKEAIIASGSIPMVLLGVRDIPGAKRGVYRDGGIIDYHLDLPQSDAGRMTLYLHFYDRITPGWFDKKISWRRPDPANIDDTILISPSEEFVRRLPHGKIPDRSDFINLSTDERVRAWRGAVAACEELADEFNEVLEKDALAARLQPFR